LPFKLDLDGSAVCDAGNRGVGARSITNVTTLFRSKSLRWLILVQSSVTDPGLVGLQLARALEIIDLCGCAGIVDTASIVLRAAEWSVTLFFL
jgi:hypothetical protein